MMIMMVWWTAGWSGGFLIGGMQSDKVDCRFMKWPAVRLAGLRYDEVACNQISWTAIWLQSDKMDRSLTTWLTPCCLFYSDFHGSTPSAFTPNIICLCLMSRSQWVPVVAAVPSATKGARYWSVAVAFPWAYRDFRLIPAWSKRNGRPGSDVHHYDSVDKWSG